MILLKFVVIVLNLFIYLCKVLEFTYRYQLKEYRYDRMCSYLNEEGWWKVLYRPELVFPGKKGRNLGIVALLLGSAIIWAYFVYDLSIFFLLAIGLVTPILALADVSILVAISGIFAKWHRERIIRRAEAKLQTSKAKIIMVSGSYGKSSVKEYLYHLLKEDFKVAKTDANMNTDVGVALSILKNLKSTTEYFIAEVGAYRIGEIAKICRSFPPHYVIITAYGNQHLDLYGSKENLVAAESEPLAFLGKDQLAVLNKDIPEYTDLKLLGEFQTLSYSMKTVDADTVVKKLKTTHTGVTAEVNVSGKTVAIRTGLLGEHVVQNLLPAITLARQVGVRVASLEAAIAELPPILNKLSLHTGPRGCTILSDASNSNVNGFIEAIRVLNTFPHEHKLLITKGIIELGSEKEASYRDIVAELAKTNIHMYTTDEDFLAHGSSDHISHFHSEDGIHAALIDHIDGYTALLIEGRFSPDFLHAFHVR